MQTQLHFIMQIVAWERAQLCTDDDPMQPLSSPVSSHRHDLSWVQIKRAKLDGAGLPQNLVRLQRELGLTGQD
jgi:hypothetical protein